MKTSHKDPRERRPADRTRKRRISRRHFLLAAGTAGIGALSSIYGCKEEHMNLFTNTSDKLSAAQAAPAMPPPIDLAAPQEIRSATFGMG